MDFTAPAAGTLESTPLPELLSTLAGERRSGVVRIDGGGEVWLSEGRIYLATTPASPGLAEVIYGAEVGSVETVGAALDGDTAAKGGLDHLLGEHPGSEALLRRLLHEFNLNSLFELLVPSDAAFDFEPDQLHPAGDRFAEDSIELLAKAEERVAIWRRIAARIPSTAAVFKISERLPEHVEERVVSADEWRFLALLNGTNTVADIINDTGESAFRVCSSLYRLVLEEVIEEAVAAT